jgi:hypothetical protein
MVADSETLVSDVVLSSERRLAVPIDEAGVWDRECEPAAPALQKNILPPKLPIPSG